MQLAKVVQQRLDSRLLARLRPLVDDDLGLVLLLLPALHVLPVEPHQVCEALQHGKIVKLLWQHIKTQISQNREFALYNTAASN